MLKLAFDVFNIGKPKKQSTAAQTSLPCRRQIRALAVGTSHVKSFLLDGDKAGEEELPGIAVRLARMVDVGIAEVWATTKCSFV